MTAIEWVREGKELLLPLMDGHVTNRELRIVDKWMRKGRRIARRELNGLLDDPENVNVVRQLYAILSAAEFYLMVRH